MLETSLERLLNIYWYAPSQAYWRAFEASLYEDVSLETPVLDLGCGDGLFAQVLGLPQPLVGLDLSAKMLGRARRLGVHTKLVECGAENLPFEDGEFRSVVSNCVPEHIEPIHETLDEVSRVLAPSGLFITSVPTPQYDEWGVEFRGFQRHTQRVGHLNVWPASQWSEELARRGMETVSVVHYLNRAQFRAFMPLDILWVKPVLCKLLMGTGFVLGKLGLKGVLSRYWQRRLSRAGLDPTAESGAGAFIVARKKGTPDGTVD